MIRRNREAGMAVKTQRVSTWRDVRFGVAWAAAAMTGGVAVAQIEELTVPAQQVSIDVSEALAPKKPTPERSAQLGRNIVRVANANFTINVSAIVGGSLVIEAESPFVEVSIANPEVADVSAISSKTIYVLGKKVGRTNLTVINQHGEVDAIVNLAVVPDLAELKQRLAELLPREPIEVRSAAGGLVLSGVVSSAAKAGKAMELASKYAPDNVMNMMAVAEAQQVMLQVRFAEVRRNVLKKLGLNLTGIGTGSNASYNIISGAGLDPNAFGIAEVAINMGDLFLEVFLNALEDKGQLRTLAEPNLVALSGDTANFLAGGEFPIPVAADYDDKDGIDVTVVFKTFGISLGFTPTVIDSQLINLELETEVSAIDSSLAVKANNISIPGLVVRRAKTTVELKEGQSFAIAGLLQENFKDKAQQLPWLGDVPVLGALFRSSDFERQQTELVVIITPRLVAPVDGDRLLTPLDRITIPNEQQLFLLGAVEGDAPPRIVDAGLDSAYGYFLD